MTQLHKRIHVDKNDGDYSTHCVVSDRGKPAYTEVATLAHLSFLPKGRSKLGIEASEEEYSLIALKLHTGRTHQIRVHMQHIGHPLFGDPTYGGNVAVKGAPGGKYNAFLRNMFDTLPRQALHAKTLGFTHPGTQERMNFASDLPSDISEVLQKWRAFMGGANA